MVVAIDGEPLNDRCLIDAKFYLYLPIPTQLIFGHIFLWLHGKCRFSRMSLSPNNVMSNNGIEKHLIECCIFVERGCDHTLQNTLVTLYKGVVETLLKSMWHSHDFNGRSEINQDGSSHNVMLRHYLAGYISVKDPKKPAEAQKSIKYHMDQYKNRLCFFIP